MAYDDDPVGQCALPGCGPTGMVVANTPCMLNSSVHVDARFLEVVNISDVVDVGLQIHIGPTNRAAVDVTHNTDPSSPNPVIV